MCIQFNGLMDKRGDFFLEIDLHLFLKFSGEFLCRFLPNETILIGVGLNLSAINVETIKCYQLFHFQLKIELDKEFSQQIFHPGSYTETVDGPVADNQLPCQVLHG